MKESEKSGKRIMGGETLSFLGNDYHVLLLREASHHTKIYEKNERIVIVTGTEDHSDKPVDFLWRKLIDWYREKARVIIYHRVEHFQSKLGVQPNKIRIKEQKTRWGSCSSRGNLNFNWRIIMAPLDIVDYVVVHELCHLKHMNHSKAFWYLVETILPDYKSRKRWLKDNGSKLIF